jgi:hypothetical protein
MCAVHVPFFLFIFYSLKFGPKRSGPIWRRTPDSLRARTRGTTIDETTCRQGPDDLRPWARATAPEIRSRTPHRGGRLRVGAGLAALAFFVFFLGISDRCQNFATAINFFFFGILDRIWWYVYTKRSYRSRAQRPRSLFDIFFFFVNSDRCQGLLTEIDQAHAHGTPSDDRIRSAFFLDLANRVLPIGSGTHSQRSDRFWDSFSAGTKHKAMIKDTANKI